MVSLSYQSLMACHEFVTFFNERDMGHFMDGKLVLCVLDFVVDLSQLTVGKECL